MFSSIFGLLCSLSVAHSYVLQKDFSASSTGFFDNFRFFVDSDPTNGVVQYVDRDTATQTGLIATRSGATYIGVDSTTTLTGTENRASVRLESLDTYTHGLFVLNLAHMPGGVCGTWPAWWLLGDTDPNPAAGAQTGEIDIIENVNSADFNSATLWAYATGTCETIDHEADMFGYLDSPDCHGTQDGTGGCEIDDSRTDSYGGTFNSEGGGIYALEWTSEEIRVFFLPRNSIPTGDAGPLGTAPDPSTWGKPTAIFGGQCNLDSFFRQLYMVFNITFCGDNGDSNWPDDTTCNAKAATCEEYVRSNPEVFKDAYWLINSLKIYQ